MLVHLKVKIKALAEEARIIRKEEKKWKGGTQERASLHEHRVNSLRHEARCSYLAYAFLRNVPYLTVERSSKSDPNWKRVWEMAQRFSTVRLEEDGFKTWAGNKA